MIHPKILQFNTEITLRENTSIIDIPSSLLKEIMTFLKNDEELLFDMLESHTAADRLKENEFEIFYQLYSIKRQQSMMVVTRVPRDNPIIPTMSFLWRIAEWQEREVYDLFGIMYDDHPDLRRLFLEDEWEGFPLRKDYKDDFMLPLPEGEK